MAEFDVGEITAPGCKHALMDTVKAAVITWFGAAGRFGSLKTALETALGGQTLTNRQVYGILRRVAEEQ